MRPSWENITHVLRFLSIGMVTPFITTYLFSVMSLWAIAPSAIVVLFVLESGDEGAFLFMRMWLPEWVYEVALINAVFIGAWCLIFTVLFWLFEIQIFITMDLALATWALTLLNELCRAPLAVRDWLARR